MIGRRLVRLAAGAALALGLAASPLRAEVSEVRISKGYGVLYLPLFVMQEKKFLEAQAARAGLGDVKVTWLTLDGGNVINDAMIAGSLDIAGTGAPGFLALWSKGRGSPKTEVIGVSGMSTTALDLNVNKPEIKSLADFTPKDKIAIPGIKTSLAAVVLQMAVAKQFGPENYGKLDSSTVGLPHPEAVAALLSGRTEIVAHFASPPFTQVERADPKVRTILKASELFGPITLDVVFALRRFTEQNPKMTQAFLDALDQSCAFINDNKAETAEIFARASKVKVTPEEVAQMLEDPDSRFSATPNGIMEFATFMHRAGIIKTKPATWSDLFIPALRERAGS
ncbi:ABC transporter substrate-binding protein [Methylobacterium sp. WSM2598]|uniref:ABC transporter substrate-binding protein n=1 Tax=Methylobacterium sp. WSM2598 TaxID=398261 RepID=UPI0003773525|nr:ABC transporter substrate-binding protein [Methylobacterium sp. WSM2598]